MNNNTNPEKKDLINDDDFDLRLFGDFLFRNKKIISLCAFISVFFAYFISKSIDKVWQGQFQIVLDLKNKESRSSLGNPSLLGGFSSFLKLNNSSDSLETQVSILKSPSVLEPIYKFVYSEKNKGNFDPNKSNFSSWLNSSLDVELEEGTAVLNISYRDKNKEIILPVLNRISETYQLYSGKSKRRNFKLTKDYLNDQIDIYKERSSNSLKIVQEYAIDQDLTLVTNSNIQKVTDQNLINNIVETTNSLIKNIDIENIRVGSANRIRNIDSQIKKIKKIEDSDQLLYLSSVIPSNTNQLIQKIEELNIRIVGLKSRYTDKEQSIKKLEEQKQLLIKQQKISLINTLKAQKLAEEARMDSAERPKGVLLKYKELIRDADRDENILIALENELRAITLEEARVEDPWELITVPTLEKFPVKPEKNKIRLYGLIIGTLFGTLIAFIKEKRSNFIFDLKQLEKLFKCNSFVENDSSDEEFLKMKVNIVQDVVNVEKNKKLVFLNIGLIEDYKIKKFKSLLNLKNGNILFRSKISSPTENDNYILLTSLEKISKKEVNILIKRFEILNIKPDSIFLI